MTSVFDRNVVMLARCQLGCLVAKVKCRQLVIGKAHVAHKTRNEIQSSSGLIIGHKVARVVNDNKVEPLVGLGIARRLVVCHPESAFGGGPLVLA